MPPGLIAPIVMLAVAFSASALVLHKEARRRRLAHQLEIAMRGLEKPGVLDPRRSIRREDALQELWQRRLFALLHYRPDASGGWPPSRTIMAGVALALVPLPITAMVLPLWLALLAMPVLAVFAIRALFNWQRGRYAERLLRQLPDTIQLVVGAIRAGLPVGEAFRLLARDTAEPTRSEFVHVVAEMGLGRPAEEGLLNMYRRTGVQEYAIFSVTLSVQAKAGGRLAETLEIMGDTIRQRVAIAGRAKALAGEAKMSGQVMGALPFIMAGALSFIHPGQMAPFFNDPRGRMMLAYALGSWLIGVLMMRRLIKKGTAV